ncbi:hypothetical protein BGZ63DRAFT_442353 [Mariannaea sp. PMI_226]|nr:hypothetical protein BGZ63DRAFT_442353 [Mariannaea sp. PMI_226]
MKLPTETIQQIYIFLAPQDYNTARHTCRSWFIASLDRSLLVRMLKRGGWWSSMLQIMTPLNITRLLNLDQEMIMSKWISRECSLANLKKPALKEVGYTDFSPYVYELDHAPSSPNSPWSVPLQPRESRASGMLRPVATVSCPRQIIAMSMSAERFAVAILLEGRIGMVCDIMDKRVGTAQARTKSDYTSIEASACNMASSNTSTPTLHHCLANNMTKAPHIQDGPRSVYSGICHADDPPRSIALCSQRNCVAFGCNADALTNQDLSRWFPLASPSDHLYFLPARRGIDTGNKLRLISSAAALGDPLGSVGSIFQGFNTRFLRSGPGSGIPITHDTQHFDDGQSQRSCLPDEGPRRVSAGGADHYRAVPLSDGYHILFTDPRTGNLCLGTDAPIGSLNRLIRKVWFLPPSAASSPSPLLYAAGADTRNGVRIAATFSISSGEPVFSMWNEDASASTSLLSFTNGDGPKRSIGTNRQIVVFYTIPPDMFHDVSLEGSATCPSTLGGLSSHHAGYERLLEWVEWRPEEHYREIEIFGSSFQDSAVYPLQIQGQPIAVCGNLVELVLDSGPDMVLWALSAEGWARTWNMDVGQSDSLFSQSIVQEDGSLRYVDPDDNIVMADVEPAPTTSDMGEMAYSILDGAEGSSQAHWTTQEWKSPVAERYQRLVAGWKGDRMSGTVSVDLVEELNSITRIDVELR